MEKTMSSSLAEIKLFHGVLADSAMRPSSNPFSQTVAKMEKVVGQGVGIESADSEESQTTRIVA